MIQTMLSQIVDVNNHTRLIQDNKELPEGDKVSQTNFANYHLLVVAILLHELKEVAHEMFPDAKGVIDWAMLHYKTNLDKGTFKPCQCKECKAEEAIIKASAELDAKQAEANAV